MGIGPGSTIARLRAVVADLTIEQGEGEDLLIAEHLRMAFTLDIYVTADNALYDSTGRFKPVSELPGDIRIRSVWIH